MVANKPKASNSADARTDGSPEAARRALEEARIRREADETNRQAGPTEKQGRGGLDPVRYGDWEVKGLTSDF